MEEDVDDAIDFFFILIRVGTAEELEQVDTTMKELIVHVCRAYDISEYRFFSIVPSGDSHS